MKNAKTDKDKERILRRAQGSPIPREIRKEYDYEKDQIYDCSHLCGNAQRYDRVPGVLRYIRRLRE